MGMTLDILLELRERIKHELIQSAIARFHERRDKGPGTLHDNLMEREDDDIHKLLVHNQRIIEWVQEHPYKEKQ